MALSTHSGANGLPNDYDIVIVGAGTGGCPAAIAAARMGARVLLLEEDACAGGAPVDNFITMPCGSHVTGIYREIVSRLEREFRISVPEHGPIPRLWSRWFLPSSFRLVVADLLAAETNITLLTGARVRQPIVEQGAGGPRVTGVLVPFSSGEARFTARIVIDATGSGAIAEQAGCTAMYGSESAETFGEPSAPPESSDAVQRCTLMFIAQRLGEGALDFKAEGLTRGVDPEFGWLDRDYGVALQRSCGMYLTWGSTVHCLDTRDDVAVAAAATEALQGLNAQIAKLHANRHMVHLAPRIGIRESRRIRAETVIAEPHLREGRMPEDTVAIGNWFLDLWGGELSAGDRDVPPYGIPLRAMVPLGVENLLVAGKAISISHLAFSSWRVQPTVAAASQAAGVLAALAARTNTPPPEVPFSRTRDELTSARQGFDIFGH